MINWKKQWLKWGGSGGGSPLLPFDPPCNSMSPPPPDWIYNVILCLNNAKLVGLGQVWGLLQPGFIRWVPSPLFTKPLRKKGLELTLNYWMKRCGTALNVSGMLAHEPWQPVCDELCLIAACCGSILYDRLQTCCDVIIASLSVLLVVIFGCTLSTRTRRETVEFCQRETSVAVALLCTGSEKCWKYCPQFPGPWKSILVPVIPGN